MISRLLGMVLLILVAASFPSNANERRDYTAYTVKGEFEDVFLDVENAIINKGLVVDYVGHVNDMLKRTAKVASQADGDAPETPYIDAKYLQFCSASLTHEAVRINPKNLATCPNVIFVYTTIEKPDRVVVGYRKPEMGIPGPTRFVMEKTGALLDEIIKEAIK